MMKLIHATGMDTLRAYFRFHLLSDTATDVPKAFDEAHFDFYGRKLRAPSSGRAGSAAAANVNGALGEALGEVYVAQYFAGDSKKKMLEMVSDIENAMERDIDTLDWMSARRR
jgi:putative endopeptidase